jgi:hypothetical protein
MSTEVRGAQARRPTAERKGFLGVVPRAETGVAEGAW